VGYNNLAAGAEATDTLMRGFTTVRDVGGPVFGLKAAIDEGIVKGPRIYPSGAMITVTSGHGDFRQLTDLPRTIGGMLHRMEQLGGAVVADSPDEVRVRVREQLMQGASQVKLTAGGGVWELPLLCCSLFSNGRCCCRRRVLRGGRESQRQPDIPACPPLKPAHLSSFGTTAQPRADDGEIGATFRDGLAIFCQRFVRAGQQGMKPSDHG
jgi:hypothetical protein